MGSKVKRYVVGSVEEVSYRGEIIDHIGGSKFDFGPTEIELAQYIPDASRFALTITALDYGGNKKLSNVWLVSCRDPTANISTQKMLLDAYYSCCM